MLDLGSEVQWFNTHWGNILLLEIFCFHIVKPLMSILALLPISFNYEKPRIATMFSQLATYFFLLLTQVVAENF